MRLAFRAFDGRLFGFGPVGARCLAFIVKEPSIHSLRRFPQ